MKKKVGNSTVEFLKVPNSKLRVCFNAFSAFLTKLPPTTDLGTGIILFASSKEAEETRAIFYDAINVIGCGFMNNPEAEEKALEEYGLNYDIQLMTEGINHFLGKSFTRVTDLVKSQVETKDTETQTENS